MRKLFLYLFLFIYSVSAIAQTILNQTNAKGLKQGHWIGKYPDAKVRYEGTFVNDIPVGTWKRYHENGKVKALMVYRPGSETAKAIMYDEKGIRYAEGNFKGNRKDSIWNYYSGEKLIAFEHYTEGFLNGISCTIDREGNKIKEMHWQNGLLNGLNAENYPNGNRKSEVLYQNGKREGLAQFYYPEGQKQVEGSYLKDQFDGPWTFFDIKGKIKFRLNYTQGTLLNPETLDSLQKKEFDTFDKARGHIKEPASLQP